MQHPNLIETEDAKEQRITYTYDGVNRLRSEDYHDEEESFSFGHVFDPAQPITRENRPDVAYFYDESYADLDLGDGSVGTATQTKGQLSYVWDLSGEEHNSFDNRGRIEWTVKQIPDPVVLRTLHDAGSISSLVSYQTKFEYDSLDRITRLTYPDNDQIDYEYNARTQLASIGSDNLWSDFYASRVPSFCAAC